MAFLDGLVTDLRKQLAQCQAELGHGETRRKVAVAEAEHWAGRFSTLKDAARALLKIYDGCVEIRNSSGDDVRPSKEPYEAPHAALGDDDET